MYKHSYTSTHKIKTKRIKKMSSIHKVYMYVYVLCRLGGFLYVFCVCTRRDEKNSRELKRKRRENEEKKIIKRSNTTSLEAMGCVWWNWGVYTNKVGLKTEKKYNF